jgi:hypothetical protein
VAASGFDQAEHRGHRPAGDEQGGGHQGQQQVLGHVRGEQLVGVGGDR